MCFLPTSVVWRTRFGGTAMKRVLLVSTAVLGLVSLPALAWDSIKLTEQDGSRVILVSATREQLEGMPTYKTLEDKQAEADAAAAQQQVQQQQQGLVPSPGVAPPAPAPAPSNQ